MKRHAVNKTRSAKTFRRNSGRTRAINIAPKPTRGGGRL